VDKKVKDAPCCASKQPTVYFVVKNPGVGACDPYAGLAFARKPCARQPGPWAARHGTFLEV
jgi:hypothetical protein